MNFHKMILSIFIIILYCIQNTKAFFSVKNHPSKTIYFPLQLSNVYLTTYQTKLIHSILHNITNELSFGIGNPKQKQMKRMKQKIEQILFYKYYKYTHSLTYRFCEEYPYLIQNIRRRELLQYAMIGLLHACRNYKGISPFHIYLQIYVKYSLYRGIRECNTLSYCYLHQYKKSKQTKILRKRDNLEFIESNSEKERKIEQIKQKIGKMNISNKRMFYLMYDPLTLEKKRNYKQVADLSGCTKESVRQRFLKIYGILRSEILTNK